MQRLHVLAVDGLDPDVLEALAGAGLLDGFQQLLDRGARSRVEPLYPVSPEIWTSYATGRTREVHGVAGFRSHFLGSTRLELPESDLDFALLAADRFVPWVREERPRSSLERTVPAIWELLDRERRSAVVVNWWATYPPDRIDGIMVTPYASPWGDAVLHEPASPGDAVWPPSIGREIVRMIRAARSETNLADGIPLVVRAARVRDGVSWRTYEAFCGEPAARLCAAYIQSIDIVSHQHRNFSAGGGDARATGVDTLGVPATVVAEYLAVDRRIRSVLDTLPDDVLLVVLSDHGWDYFEDGHDSRPDGVLLLYGAPVVTPGAFGPIGTLDVFPTLAAILGLPLSGELSGSPALGPLGPDRFELGEVDTYGVRTAGRRDEHGAADEDQLEDLRSLGYIQ